MRTRRTLDWGKNTPLSRLSTKPNRVIVVGYADTKWGASMHVAHTYRGALRASMPSTTLRGRYCVGPDGSVTLFVPHEFAVVTYNHSSPDIYVMTHRHSYHGLCAQHSGGIIGGDEDIPRISRCVRDDGTDMSAAYGGTITINQLLRLDRASGIEL